jgi:hypothetical protein
MGDRDSGSGMGLVGGILAFIGALTVMGILAVAASVLAWEMELRRSEQQEAAVPEPPAAPNA